MAKDKKSVLLYCDIIHTIEKMDNETAGLFFKHYLRYINDLNPTTDNLIVDITFESVKQNLKRDLKKWEDKTDERSESGKLGNLKRWYIDIYKRVISNEITLEDGIKESLIIANNRSAINGIANIAVTVTDTVTVNDINNEVTTPPSEEIENRNPKKEKPSAGEGKEKSSAKKESFDWEELLKYFNSITGMNKRVVSAKVKNQFTARLREGYTKQDVSNSIKNAFNHDFHKENNYQYLTLEYISRSDTLDKYMEVKKRDSEKIRLNMNTK